MEIIKRKSGDVFREKVYGPDGKAITKSFKRKTDAKNWKNKIHHEILQNEIYGKPMLKNAPFEQVAEEWHTIKIKSIRSQKTSEDYQYMMQKHLFPLLNGVAISRVKVSHAEGLIQELAAKGRQPRTVNRIMMVFKQIMKFASKNGYLAQSPLVDVSPLKITQTHLEFLIAAEVMQLLRSNVHEPEYPILVVALNTGMRIGEIFGLCWDRVNFEQGHITVSRSLSRKELRDCTKTSLIRHIPMNPECENILKDLWRKQKSPKWVFTESNGEPLRPDHFSSRDFKRALERANLRKIRFHDLRHSYASNYMMNGGNIFDLQKILGHTRVEMTMRYAHLTPDHLKSAAKVVRFSAEGNYGSSPHLAHKEISVDKKLVNLGS